MRSSEERGRPAGLWWVLFTGLGDAGWNMAVDEWLMRTAPERPPTLRVYGWRHPTVSLGRNEPWRRAVDLRRLEARGVRLVRRPTGGRAVLHHRELTYSVTAAPRRDRQVGVRLAETLACVSEGLAEGLRLLGVESRAVRRDQPVPRRDGACFESATRYELVAGGRKLVGNAQYRTTETFLQHGSLPVYPTLGELYALGAGARPAPRAEAWSLPELAAGSLDRLAPALAEGFARRFGCRLVHRSPGVLDGAAVRALVTRRYASRAWTFRR